MQFNSEEEKIFWDKLPDWTYRTLNPTSNWILYPPSHFLGKASARKNARGETIDKNSSEGFDGYVKYSSKSYRTIYQFVDGYTSRWKSWFKSGKQMAEGNYLKENRDGTWNEWLENGEKKSEINYKDGKLEGLSTTWYENGQKKMEVNFVKSLRSGPKTQWYRNGQKRFEARFNGGRLESCVVWKPRGEKCPVSLVEAGTGVVVNYKEDGSEQNRLVYSSGSTIQNIGAQNYETDVPAGTLDQLDKILSEQLEDSKVDAPAETKFDRTKRLAEGNDKVAQFRLGLMYVNAEGVPSDLKEAVNWFTKAGEQGHAQAQMTLGNMYLGRYAGIPKDLVSSYAWFNLAANNGMDRAVMQRGILGGLISRSQIAEAEELSKEIQKRIEAKINDTSD